MSNGISIATIPDVCKTPSPAGPVPIPYPNIAQSITLSDGTTTVKGDKMMAAIKGSKFTLSNGDNAGVAGGVKSSTFMKEATWILYSFDVKLDGKNACRLTDKMFHNAENAANLAGIFQPPRGLQLTDDEKKVGEALCEAFCKKLKEGFHKQGNRWVKNSNVKRWWSNELEKELSGKTVPWGALRVTFPAGRSVGTFLGTVTKPDAVAWVVSGKRSIQRCFDFKFPGDRFRGSQRARLAMAANGRRPVPISTKTCSC